MKTEVQKYFDVKYGTNDELINLQKDSNGINFVSRTSKNNGISARVKLIKNKIPNPANTISVSCGGSVMESFLQKKEYYSGRDIYILIPKIKLTDKQLLFYCMCLRENKYRYNYGRQANKSLKEINIPSIDEIPKWVEEINIPKKISDESLSKKQIIINTNKWKSFRYDKIFDIKKGYYNKKPPISKMKEIPFIGATDKNNGVTSYHLVRDIEGYNRNGKKDNSKEERIFLENCITISNNGSVGYAFYQPKKFTCSHDVNPVYLIDKKMNVFIALFLCTIIGLERYRWNYGRKWRPKRMPYSIIKLPQDDKGNPDWQFMEDYIKSLPYSKSLKN
jgi:hypothetical protein